MGNPIDRTAKAALDSNLVNGVVSDAPKVKSNNDVLYNYVDGLNNGLDAHASSPTLPHADQSVTGPKIKDGTITEPKYATGSVSSRAIANGAVGVNQLATGLGASVDVQAQFAKRGIDITSAPYNAVVDGVTDCTPIIQAANNALSAAGGGVLYFPKGTYKVNSLVSVASNIVFIGQGVGSVIDTSSNPGEAFTMTGKSNVIFEKLKFYGPTIGPYSRAIDIAASSSKIKVYDCYFNRYNGGGVVIRSSSYCEISHCTFEAVNNNPSVGADYGSINIEGSRNNTITNNIIYDFSYSGICLYNGDENTIANNIIKALPGASLSMGIFALEGSSNNIFSGNQIKNVQNEGIAIIAGNNNKDCSGNIVSDNRIIDCVFTGISLQDSGSFTVKQNTVCNNIITSTESISTDHGIYIDGASENQIIGNKIIDYSTTSGAGILNGITTQNGTSSNRISGNIIKNCSIGIVLTGAASSCIDNTVHSCISGITIAFLVHGICSKNNIRSCTTGLNFGGSNSYSQVTENDLSSCTTQTSGTINIEFRNNLMRDVGYSGTATLVAGAVTVSSMFGLQTSSAPLGRIILGFKTPSANAGAIYVSNVDIAVPAFTIRSTNASDTSVVTWRIEN